MTRSKSAVKVTFSREWAMVAAVIVARYLVITIIPVAIVNVVLYVEIR